MFPPGCIIYHVSDGRDCALKFKDGYYQRTPTVSAFLVNYDCVECDGTNFGLVKSTLGIYEFKGTKPIAELTCFPLEFHPNVSKVKETLLARGRLYEEYRGFHYKAYKGNRLKDPQYRSFY